MYTPAALANANAVLVDRDFYERVGGGQTPTFDDPEVGGQYDRLLDVWRDHGDDTTVRASSRASAAGMTKGRSGYLVARYVRTPTTTSARVVMAVTQPSQLQPSSSLEESPNEAVDPIALGEVG